MRHLGLERATEEYDQDDNNTHLLARTIERDENMYQQSMDKLTM